MYFSVWWLGLRFGVQVMMLTEEAGQEISLYAYISLYIRRNHLGSCSMSHLSQAQSSSFEGWGAFCCPKHWLPTAVFFLWDVLQV